MLTETGYPFVEGAYGISPIFLQPTRDTVTIYSASGKPLVFRMNEREVYIAENESKDFRLHAEVRAGILSLDLKTTRTTPPNQFEKHPDLFAARFVAFSLKHFQDLGIPVNSAEEVWDQVSINYDVFISGIAAGQDKVSAARKTWSGRILGKHGFTRILPEKIRVNYQDGMQPEIIALFEKE